MTRCAAAGAKSLHVAAGGGYPLLSAGYTKCILASTITLHTRNACAVSVVTAVSRQVGGLDAARSDFQRFQGSLRAPVPGLLLLIMGFLWSLREYSAGTSEKCGGCVGVRLARPPRGLFSSS